MLVTLAFLIVFVATGMADKGPDMFNLTVPESPVSAPLGASVTLPCAVSPTFSVVPHKMSWHPSNLDENPVLLYENEKIQQDPDGTGYRGRVSLVGSLEQGNVSIKLENITLADRGLYVCFVHSEVWFEEANVALNVEVMGTLPLLSVSKGDEKQVNVTCTSEGWSPQPALTWTSGGENINAANTVYTTDDQGLVSVSSWLLHSPSESESVSCFVGLSDQERKDGRVVPFIYTEHKGGVIGGIISGLVLLILIPTAILLYRKVKEKNKETMEKDKVKWKKNDVVAEYIKLVGEKQGVLRVLQAQIKTTTTRLTNNKEALKNLTFKIQATRNLQEGDDQLLKDLAELDQLAELDEKLNVHIEGLKAKMEKLKKNEGKKMKDRGKDQKIAGSQADVEMALFQPKLEKEGVDHLLEILDEIKSSVSDLEKKVALAELRNQVAETTRRLNNDKKDLNDELQAEKKKVKDLEREKSGILNSKTNGTSDC
ncbi:butyrophilin subfamily 1 member A1-like isoform X1 [Alosa sapidissima]|uniref:butyrophilin subfamily 1 member A1-like isoform X1 n=1 Tax=Alosa sapidissima TaxID=34773 RepID=UPI001C0A4F6A|nr:butyrophilin subfamily 1 member A1-like isoform X1 [Alosa sapidissima]